MNKLINQESAGTKKGYACMLEEKISQHQKHTPPVQNRQIKRSKSLTA